MKEGDVATLLTSEGDFVFTITKAEDGEVTGTIEAFGGVTGKQFRKALKEKFYKNQFISRA